MRETGILLGLAGLLLAAAGCAPGYRPQGFTGGYSSLHLGDNVFRVTFNGNAYIGAQRVADYALLRAAEVALEHGFRWFVVTDGRDAQEVFRQTTPRQTHTYGNLYLYGNQGFLQANSYETGGETYTYVKPSTTLLIVCYHRKPDVSDRLVYDAARMSATLRQHYGLPASEVSRASEQLDVESLERFRRLLDEARTRGEQWARQTLREKGYAALVREAEELGIIDVETREALIEDVEMREALIEYIEGQTRFDRPVPPAARTGNRSDRPRNHP